ncbi:hypothetical protein JOF56_009349 [Kibdelosporangium banguiense]|uniref:Aminopeptidase n=1 Tax=Kibdelosporangium banguiense TaxID=1365924 RepID=A0ABS4TX35_9PSEU|nr:alpha/beta fold hydrolase [Kibdelosporangium banguiense]MBP2328964.1 hypothetical protein [Kibdelosporangium banguiense]
MIEPQLDTDISERIQAVAGMELVETTMGDGFKFHVFTYEQPVDHRDPAQGTFRQRFTMAHRSATRPTVFLTSGYYVGTQPRRVELAELIDGNQVALEHRFFTPSRPDPADWSKLTIWQAASDQHRLFHALKPIYRKNWLATGGSKGGMTATYYARFYSHDMDGVVAYGSPNHLPESRDVATDRFFARTGTPEHRAALIAVQREALLRWDEMMAHFNTWAQEKGHTFDIAGNAEIAFEGLVRDMAWRFWQNKTINDPIPVTTASSEELFAFIDAAAGWDNFTDERLMFFEPYYVAAGLDLGFPSYTTPHLDGLLRHPSTYGPRHRVRRDIPLNFAPEAMRDIDRWVRENGRRLMFVYGENDPWGAEPFRIGPGSVDSYVYVARDGNHASTIASLDEDDKAAATATARRWAGL